MKDSMTNPSRQALLAPSDIAKLAAVSAAAVSNWRKRSDDFPPPAGGTSARPLFARDDVLAWMKANNKPAVDLASSNAIAAMNLVHELRAPLSSSLDDAAVLVASLISARKLSDEGGSEPPLWQDFLKRAGDDGFAALRRVGDDHSIDRWDDLVVLPPFADEIPPMAVEQIVRLLTDVPEEEMAEAADAVLARAVGAMGRSGSEHGYVGSKVSEFLAQMSAPDAHGVVYDPACGIGVVLAQLSDSVERAAIHRMVAHDVNEQAVVLARQRGFLREAPLEVRSVDVLATDPAPDLKADLVVAEPPFGMHYEGYDLLDRRWTYGTPSKSSSELAWIQHAVSHLTADGVAYVVTSGGPLFRGGRDGEIRRGLVGDGCVHAIYQLPAKLLQHTSIPVAVWVLGRPGTSDTIRFVNAETLGVTRAGRTILPTFSGRREFEEANPVADVAIVDVLAGDANLVPERWIGLDTPDPAAVVGEYDDAVARILEAGRALGGPSVRQFRASDSARVLTVRELESHGVLEVRTGRSGAQRSQEADPRRVNGRDIGRGRLGQVNDVSDLSAAADETRCGDVLVATHGQLAATIDEFGGHTLGAGVVGLRVVSDQLRSDYLATVVDGKWNKRFFTGSTIQRVAVRDLEVPLLTLEDQEAFARATEDLIKVHSLAGRLQAAAAEALESLAEVARFGVDEGDANQ